MTNSEKLTVAFSKALGIPPKDVTENLSYNSIPEWDSVAHMSLISEVETTFGIMLDTDDVIDLSSVAKCREILAKYQIEA
jgi:acyl carrier protein